MEQLVAQQNELLNQVFLRSIDLKAFDIQSKKDTLAENSKRSSADLPEMATAFS